jgi:hypothetical protein
MAAVSLSLKADIVKMIEVVALSLGLAVALSYLVLEFPRVSISGNKRMDPRGC